MPDIKSIAAVKEAIGGENFDNNINVVVTDEKNNIKYVSNICSILLFC